MKRDAKDKENFQKLSIDYILDNTSFDNVPYCVCPIHSFPDMMSTVFCATKCYTPCENFRHFSFILDHCDDEDCGIKSMCESCLQKVEEFKKIMMKLKAVFPKRNTDKFVNHRVNKYIEWCNDLSKKLKEARNNEIS